MKVLMLIHQLFKYLTQFIYYLIFPTDYPNLAMHKDVYLSVYTNNYNHIK